MNESHELNEWEAWLSKCVHDACVAEVSFEKPGNVSLTDTFPDSSAIDFVKSADVVAPVISKVATSGVGRTILDAVLATRNAVGHNTNLGIILLLAPLAAVPRHLSLADGIGGVLSALTVDDAVVAYRAIAAASPGGLGEAEDQDVAKPPTEDLRYCMTLAADRDLVAAQYANEFHTVLVGGLEQLLSTRHWPVELWKWRIGWLAVSLVARQGDSLILRKCGLQMSRQVEAAAGDLLETGWPLRPGNAAAYEKFDQFLRADGHRRNPGTTADIIAAILFAAFREGLCVFDESAADLVFTD